MQVRKQRSESGDERPGVVILDVSSLGSAIAQQPPPRVVIKRAENEALVGKQQQQIPEKSCSSDDWECLTSMS